VYTARSRSPASNASLVLSRDRGRPSSLRRPDGEAGSLGLTPRLLLGDSRSVVERVTAEVGIDRAPAEVYPEDKVAEVQRL